MRHTYWLLGTGLLVACLLTAGCGKKVQQAAEMARVAKDAQDGSFTMKGEDGQEIKVQAGKSGEDAKVTVTDEKGGTTTSEYGAQAVKQEDVGIDFYPGAEVLGGAKAAAQSDKSGKSASVQLTSSDSFDQVAKFYKDKYAAGNTVMDQPGSVMISITSGENAGKMIMVSPGEEGKTNIVIHASEGM